MVLEESELCLNDVVCKLDFDDVPPCVHESMISVLGDLKRKSGSNLKIRDAFYIDCSDDRIYRFCAYSYFRDGFGIESCLFFHIYIEFDFEDHSYSFRAESKCLAARK